MVQGDHVGEATQHYQVEASRYMVAAGHLFIENGDSIYLRLRRPPAFFLLFLCPFGKWLSGYASPVVLCWTLSTQYSRRPPFGILLAAANVIGIDVCGFLFVVSTISSENKCCWLPWQRIIMWCPRSYCPFRTWPLIPKILNSFELSRIPEWLWVHRLRSASNNQWRKKCRLNPLISRWELWPRLLGIQGH